MKKKSGIWPALCQKRVRKQRLHATGINLDHYKKICQTKDGNIEEEAIYRYLTDDTSIYLCKHCQTNTVRFITFKKKWGEFCGASCSAKWKVENGLTISSKSGWKHTEETKKKMSENHADFTGPNNPFRNKLLSCPEARREASIRAKKRWQNYTKEELEIRSIRASKSQAMSKAHNNPNRHKNHKSGHFYSIKCDKSMFYRSSWELKVCKFLENSNDIISYQIEPFCIKYKNADNHYRYLRADFIATHSNGKTFLMEVKPKAFVLQERTQFKIKGYQKYAAENNMIFLLITETELVKLGDIIK